MRVASPSLASGLVSSYDVLAERYDELLGEDRAPRPHWRKFLAHIEGLGEAELERRWAKAHQLLHENGVSYNVYGDPQGMERPWNLSPMPVLLPQSQWDGIEVGVAQRARLLAALLADLYGPQRTLSEGLLPPEIVFANPSFLRACHGAHLPTHSWLPLYGVDLIRLPGGEFVALDDRTQAPSGAGYALENRIIISSILPEAFRDCNVERLALFFRTLRATLAGLAPHNRDNPCVVLLTAGPHNATYFEQAYLAHYLGYPLVNGGDLAVRDDRVYLKTLGGLSPVDAILRRLNDDYCDPLELRPESLLGIPGLVEAARAGNVAVANALGSGVLQTAAILPYLDKLCRALLGEELRLKSVRTLWCGEPSALAEAAPWFADAVVKPAFSETPVHPTFTAQLSSAERDQLWANIRSAPSRYVLQERARGSSTPALSDVGLEPRPLVLRAFAVAGVGDYVVMPGGLSRVAGPASGSEISMQLGADSKDTWVLSDAPVSSFSLLPSSTQAVELSRGGNDLPSRAADNLYWLGRYAERAEGVARLARVIAARLGDLATHSDFTNSPELVVLLRALTAQTSRNAAAPPDRVVAETIQTASQALTASIFDEQSAGSMKCVLRATLHAGRQVRDRISTDTWRILAAIGDDLQHPLQQHPGDALGALQETLNRSVLRLAAFSGVAMESMTRGHAWRFLDMGRRLERAMALMTLLRTTLGERSQREGPLLEAVLEVADSGMTYHRRYLANLQVVPVLDLLLTDETNPRAAAFQMEALTRHIERLPRLDSGLRSTQERLALGLLTQLRLVDVGPLCAVDAAGRRPELGALLLHLIGLIPALSDSLTDRYLNHATVSRHLQRESGRMAANLTREGRL